MSDLDSFREDADNFCFVFRLNPNEQCIGVACPKRRPRRTNERTVQPVAMRKACVRVDQTCHPYAETSNK